MEGKTLNPVAAEQPNLWALLEQIKSIKDISYYKKWSGSYRAPVFEVWDDFDFARGELTIKLTFRHGPEEEIGEVKPKRKRAA